MSNIVALEKRVILDNAAIAFWYDTKGFSPNNKANSLERKLAGGSGQWMKSRLSSFESGILGYKVDQSRVQSFWP